MTIPTDSMLPSLIKIAEDAGKAILDVYAGADFNIEYKEGGSPLTQADMDSHRIIDKELGLLSPKLPVLSEESKEVPFSERKSWDSYWLIDPLDGTKEFIKRSGEFTVNIALIEKGVPVIGVVYAPVLNLTYCAEKNVGAFKKVNDEELNKIKISSYDGGKLKIVASRSHATEELEHFLKDVDSYEKINMGSSLKFCLVAEGAAHFYPRFGPTMEWDTAAAHCVVTEAGGIITDTEGNPLKYNKPNLLNPNFIVSGNPWSYWKKYFE